MAIWSLKDLYVDELGDLYDAETQIVSLLPRLVDAAHAPELRDVLARHGEESRLHLERLQLIFTRLGARPRDRRCLGVAGLVQEADNRVNDAATPDARDAAIIGAAQRIEHYEIASYGCARTYARRLDRGDEARLLQETLDEEGNADRSLTEIAEAHINDDARTEQDMHDTPRSPGRLAFVDGSQFDHHRLAPGDLEVRSDADDTLGVFDGLVVDTATNRARYVVVHEKTLLGGKRYLLPVGQVRYDQPARALRVDLAREVAERYPAFDRDEFAAMDDAALGGYESSLAGFFRKADDGRHLPRTALDREPEWLMTGMWMVVPPERASTLTNEARSFANEFSPRRVQEDEGPGTA